jgi:molybdate transport system substrate-binding protein
MRRALLVAAATTLAAQARPVAAQGAEIRVLAGSGIAPAMQELAPRFERASGHRVVLFFGPTPELTAEATSGRGFDLGVVPAEMMRNAAVRARFEASPEPVTIARVGYGVAVRAGEPRPDISSGDRLRQALLAAPSVATFPGSSAGAYILSVFDRMGIGQEMRGKLVVPATPAGIAAAVARGEARLGVFLTNVLAAPGVELAGPFPPEYQQDLIYLGARSVNGTEGEATGALLRYLRSAEAEAVLRAKGLTPGLGPVSSVLRPATFTTRWLRREGGWRHGFGRPSRSTMASCWTSRRSR